jgi:hypothetical protein
MYKKCKTDNAPDPMDIIKQINFAKGNKQIISIDFSNGEDYSAMNSICGNCKMVIETETIKEYGNTIPVTVFKKCPNCGIDFISDIICE